MKIVHGQLSLRHFCEIVVIWASLRLSPLIKLSMFPWSPAVEMLKLNELEN